MQQQHGTLQNTGRSPRDCICMRACRGKGARSAARSAPRRTRSTSASWLAWTPGAWAASTSRALRCLHALPTSFIICSHKARTDRASSCDCAWLAWRFGVRPWSAPGHRDCKCDIIMQQALAEICNLSVRAFACLQQRTVYLEPVAPAFSATCHWHVNQACD